MSRFTGASYEGSISVTNPADDEVFRLVVFASRDVHQHAAFNETVILQTGSEKFSFEYAMEEHPRWLHFLLFSNAADDHGILNQSLLAWGNLEASAGGVARLVDVRRKTQAMLTIKPKNPVSSLPAQLQPSTETTEISQSMIDQVRSVYKDLTHTVDSYLNWVETPMGKVPVLPFIASISCILTDAKLDQDRAEEFLLHQFDLAQTNLGLRSKDWEKCSLSEKCKWLSEAVTLMPRSMIYEQDSVRIDKNHHEPADQWVRLLNFPEANLASFDCEDSAILCLEVLYLIQHTLFQTSRMQQVQQFCKPYTACFVFGTLRIGEEYCPHAYAALLDSRYLESPSSVSAAPAILFEGTARLGGSWAHDRTTKASDDSYSVHTSLLKQLGSGKGYGRVLRNESSLEFVKQNEIYGPVYGLITGDHNGRDALHLLAHRQGSEKIGVPADELYSGKSTVAFKVAASYPNSANSEFMQLCNELPRSHIPFVATSKNSYHKSQGEFYVAMHYETYKQREEEVQAALSELRGLFTITGQVLQVTDQLKQQQFWFRAKPA